MAKDYDFKLALRLVIKPRRDTKVS